jgi:Na+-transporting NADH:ubiquinone oxidoreductase subunit A
VVAGTPLFEDKGNAGFAFVSPTSGTVRAIVRGEKRALLAVVIAADGEEQSLPYSTDGISDAEGVRRLMIASGAWTLLRQRPFGTIPSVYSKPKAVFISAFDSSPLPVDYAYMLEGREEEFQAGIDALQRVARTVHLSLHTSQRDTFIARSENAQIHFFEGPHPCGLVGTQISKIDPINKGESVWTVNVQDVATIGHLMLKGEYRPERVIATCGPTLAKPQYYRVLSGIRLDALELTAKSGKENGGSGQRVICGDVLSGKSVCRPVYYLAAGCDKISVLPEGDYYDFLGWLRPNLHKFSFSRTFMSGIFRKTKANGARYDFDTGMHGGRRPLFVTGEFEKLVPIDIYPLQLIKACVVGDIELMENLGIYEVEPEDFALCEFADTSKTEIQAIIRAALENIRKEG